MNGNNDLAVLQPVPRTLYEDEELRWAIVYGVWEAKLQLFSAEPGIGPLYVRTVGYSYFINDGEFITGEDGPWTIAAILATGPAVPDEEARPRDGSEPRSPERTPRG